MSALDDYWKYEKYKVINSICPCTDKRLADKYDFECGEEVADNCERCWLLAKRKEDK